MMRFMYGAVAIMWLLINHSFAQFSDLNDSLYQQSVEALTQSGVINGYSDNTYRPDQPINRAEFLKILLESKFKSQVSVYRSGKNTCFADLPSGDLWYKVYACVGKDRNIISGFPDGTFRGAETVNKAQAAKILYNVYFSPLTVETKPWYQGYYNQLKTKEIFLNFFNESPTSPLTRGQMAFAIQQFSRYPSHQLLPPSIKTKPLASKNIAPVSSEAPTPVPSTPISTPDRLKVSPEYVVKTAHPKTKIGGSYITSWDQWIQAKYPASTNNFKTSAEQQYILSAQVLETVNEARQAVGVSTMYKEDELEALAQNFATHLVVNAFYSHSDKLGRDPIDRAKLAGIEGWVAESIVWRHRDPLEAIKFWKKSAVHWKSVGSNHYTKAGVGIAQEPTGGWIVVMLQGE